MLARELGTEVIISTSQSTRKTATIKAKSSQPINNYKNHNNSCKLNFTSFSFLVPSQLVVALGIFNCNWEERMVTESADDAYIHSLVSKVIMPKGLFLNILSVICLKFVQQYCIFAAILLTNNISGAAAIPGHVPLNIVGFDLKST